MGKTVIGAKFLTWNESALLAIDIRRDIQKVWIESHPFSERIWNVEMACAINWPVLFFTFSFGATIHKLRGQLRGRGKSTFAYEEGRGTKKKPMKHFLMKTIFNLEQCGVQFCPGKNFFRYSTLTSHSFAAPWAMMMNKGWCVKKGTNQKFLCK